MPSHKYCKKPLVGTIVKLHGEDELWFVCDMYAEGVGNFWLRSTSDPTRTRIGKRSRMTEHPLFLTVTLHHGPDCAGKGWSFVTLRPGGEVDSTFGYPADAELTADEIIREAWDHAEHPDRVEDILLNEELQKLFPEGDLS